MMYVSMFIAGSAAAARDVAVERHDSTPTSYSTIMTVVMLQLSLALFLWALFRDAEPKSESPAEEKKPEKPELTVEVPARAEPKPELPLPYTSYQEKQLRQIPRFSTASALSTPRRERGIRTARLAG